MKRTPIARGTSTLTRSVQLARTTPLRRSSVPHQPAQRPHQPRTGLDWPQDTRDTVQHRSGGRCEIALKGACTGPATDLHHRQPRRTRNHTPANALHTCRNCHTWAHTEPAAAYGLGWLVHTWQTPHHTTALIRGRRLLLTTHGTYAETTP